MERDMKYEGIIDDRDIQEYHFTDAKSAHNLMEFILWCGEGSVSQDEIPTSSTNIDGKDVCLDCSPHNNEFNLIFDKEYEELYNK